MRTFPTVFLLALLLGQTSSCGKESHSSQFPTGPLTPAVLNFTAELFAPGQGPGACVYAITFSYSLDLTVQQRCAAFDDDHPATQKIYSTSISQATKDQVEKNLALLRRVEVATRYASDDEIADAGGYTITFTRVDDTTFSTFVETGSESKLPPPLAELYGLLRDGVIHR